MEWVVFGPGAVLGLGAVLGVVCRALHLVMLFPLRSKFGFCALF